MGDVERRQLLAPSRAGIGVPDRPVRMVAQDGGPLPHQERRHPDAGPPAGVPDPPDDVGQRGEAVRQGQPVAQLGLVAVVDLDDVEGEIELAHGDEVLLDVGLGDVLEVVVPGAPGRGRQPQVSDAGRSGEAVAPVRERVVERDVAGRVVHLRHLDDRGGHRPVGGDDDAVAPRLRPDRRDRSGTGGGAEDVHPLTGARVDGQQALSPEAVGRGGPVGAVVAYPALLADRPERPPVEPVGQRRAPRLPTVLVDPGPLRIDGQGGEDVAGGARQRGRQPFTEPAVSPRTKYRCSEMKTTIGTIIVNRPPAVSSCQPCPWFPAVGSGRWEAAG